MEKSTVKNKGMYVMASAKASLFPKRQVAKITVQDVIILTTIKACAAMMIDVQYSRPIQGKIKATPVLMTPKVSHHRTGHTD